MNEWTAHHGTLAEPLPYGAPETYLLAARWVQDCETVEDWGCGGGGLRAYINPHNYRGIDGSGSPYADFTADLTDYRSDVDGIVLRHVLEHDYRWEQILANAVASFRQRLCIVLFTPLVGHTHLLHTEPDYGDAPVIAFAQADLDALLAGVRYRIETRWFEHAHFGTETLLYASR